MKIAIDISSITDKAKDAHRVRGIGSYTHELVSALQRFTPQDQVIGFRSPAEIPSDVDVIHYPYFDPFFINLPIIKTKKYVVTVHDMIPLIFPQDFPVGVTGNLKWLMQRYLLSRADAIISVSNASKKDIVTITGIKEEKITRVYNGVSEVFRQKIAPVMLDSIKKKYHLPSQFVLYVGDVTVNKNVPRLVRAASSLMPIVLVGKALLQTDFDRTSPWNRDLLILERLARNNPRIIRIGFLPEEDLVCLYQLATVFAMPSLYEGFGLPILEAMKSLCPVLTSRRGALPEVAGDAALYVQPEDEMSIQAGIQKMVKSAALRKSLVEKGLKQAEKFSWPATASATRNIYNSCITHETEN